MHITEKTKEYECCVSCKHNKRKKDGENIYCECEIDGHYIGYIASFDNVCERWVKNNMNYETLRNSMTVQDAARVLMETNCYGTMDIAKNVILKALEEQPSERTEEGTETHACDYISRKFMHDMGATCIAARNKDGDLVALGALDILPSATPQPKTGHWTHDGGCWKNRWICSECGYKLYDEQSKYCPNCGSYNGGERMNELTKIKDRILARIEMYIGDIEFAQERELTEDEKTIFDSVKHIINEELSEKVVHLNAENKPRLSKPAFTVIDYVLKEHEEHEDRFTTFCDGRHQQITVKQINAELDKLYNYFYGKGEESGEGIK